MWHRVIDISYVKLLYEHEEQSFDQVHVLIKVGPRALCHEHDVDCYDEEPTHAENCVVEQYLLRANIQAIIERIKLPFDLRLLQSILVLD